MISLVSFGHRHSWLSNNFLHFLVKGSQKILQVMLVLWQSLNLTCLEVFEFWTKSLASLSMSSWSKLQSCGFGSSNQALLSRFLSFFLPSLLSLFFLSAVRGSWARRTGPFGTPSLAASKLHLQGLVRYLTSSSLKSKLISFEIWSQASSSGWLALCLAFCTYSTLYLSLRIFEYYFSILTSCSRWSSLHADLYVRSEWSDLRLT